MVNYKKIHIWENKRRRRELFDFLEVVNTYFKNIEYSYTGFQITENEIAAETRFKINMRINRIANIMKSAGIVPVLMYSPPPAVGGASFDVNLLSELFNLHTLQISPRRLADFIEIGIGIYEDDVYIALIRSFNPFFWFGKFIDYLVNLPFRFLGNLGYNQDKIESSSLGRILRGFLYLIHYLVATFASMLIILNSTGNLPKFMSIFSGEETEMIEKNGQMKTLFFVKCENNMNKLVFDFEKRNAGLFIRVMYNITREHTGYPQIIRIDWGEVELIPAQKCKFNKDLYYNLDEISGVMKEKRIILDDLKILEVPEEILILLKKKYLVDK